MSETKNKVKSKDKLDLRKCAMYGEMPIVQVGDIHIAQWAEDSTDIWIEIEGEEGAQLRSEEFKKEFNELLHKIFNKYF